MDRRLISMNDTADKQDLYELLPWQVNGTLEGDERDAVRELLAGDLEANRQARELRVLRAALGDEPIMATNMMVNLRRLSARLDPPRPSTRRWFVPLSLAAAAVLAIAGGSALFLAGERAGRFQTLSTPDAVVARVVQGPSEYGVAVVDVPEAGAAHALALLRADPRLRFVAPVAE
jgi:hypothetical protein